MDHCFFLVLLARSKYLSLVSFFFSFFVFRFLFCPQGRQSQRVGWLSLIIWLFIYFIFCLLSLSLFFWWYTYYYYYYSEFSHSFYKLIFFWNSKDSMSRRLFRTLPSIQAYLSSFVVWTDSIVLFFSKSLYQTPLDYSMCSWDDYHLQLP